MDNYQDYIESLYKKNIKKQGAGGQEKKHASQELQETGIGPDAKLVNPHKSLIAPEVSFVPQMKIRLNNGPIDPLEKFERVL